MATGIYMNGKKHVGHILELHPDGTFECLTCGCLVWAHHANCSNDPCDCPGRMI